MNCGIVHPLKSTVFLLVLCISFKLSLSKCSDSFVTICDSVSDVTRFGRKNWTNLMIHLNDCQYGSSDLEVLKENVLQKCPNLEELYIIDRLEKIEVKAFQMLSKLMYINLYKNSLRVVPVDMFSNLQNLYKIELQFNDIQTIVRGAFSNLPKLTHLNLAHNKINHIGDITYDIKNLNRLDLSHNIISTINPGAFPSNLEILNLDDNALRQMNDKTFSNLNNLKELSLSRNSLKKLTQDMFTGLRNIFKLDLSHNLIDTIEVKTFHDLRTMKLLQLAHNQLKVVKVDIFPKNNAMMLQSIRLDHNKLSFLNSEIFDRLSSLRRISIGGNPWQCVCINEIQSEMSRRNVTHTPCDQTHYFSGNNPNCMQFRTDECVENVEFVGEDWPKLYFDGLENFSYDCP